MAAARKKVTAGEICNAIDQAIGQGRLARNYRAGSQACRNCRLNTVCRGCLAITHSMGLDVFTDKGPFCFAAPQITGEMVFSLENG